MGVINRKGEIIIALNYENTFDYTGSCFVVRKDGLFGAVDKTGKIVVPIVYQNYESLENGIVRFKNGQGYQNDREYP